MDFEKALANKKLDLRSRIHVYARCLQERAELLAETIEKTPGDTRGVVMRTAEIVERANALAKWGARLRELDTIQYTLEGEKVEWGR